MEKIKHIFIWKFFLFSTLFFISSNSVLAEKESVQIGDSIKIKGKQVYIKAYLSSQKYFSIKTGYGKIRGMYGYSKQINKRKVFKPEPIIVGFSTPFDYNVFFNKTIDTKSIPQIKEDVTVKIIIIIRQAGEYEYSVANQKKGKKSTGCELIAMEAFNKINKWSPAIQSNKKIFFSRMELTVVFSSTPFQD